MFKKLPAIFLFCVCFSLAYAQQSNSSKTVPVFFEKVYLHTDRDVYGQGEDIWFKAYLVNAEYNSAINYSHNLYVELIAPDTKILSRRVIRLENGLGNGDFKLTDTTAAGTYRLRAYTNWMRNFGDNFIFEKDIRILNTKPVNAAVTAAKKNTKPVIASPTLTTATIPGLRFFPEGGSMVSGVSGVVAVKAEDAFGKGVAVKGKIVNTGGVTVSDFSCDSLGFGAFILKPGAGQHYKALVNIRGQQQSIPLPEIQASGFNLALSHETDSTTVTVSCNTPTFTQNNGQHLYLTAKHGGKTYVSKIIPVNSIVNIIKMPDSWLPEGIACVTIADEDAKPLAERLVYVHHPDGIKLSINTDKTIYHPSEGVNVAIRLNTRQKASLSLAVVDAGTVPVQEGNIISYLNLQSEIKGRIESPNRYFDSTNVNRFKQLDLLLLTQGWRDFVWKRIEDTTLKLTYEPEQGINITGKVRKVWTKGTLAGINITMHAPRAEGQKLFWATTDSAGRFAIYNAQFYGYQYLNFTSRRADKINRDGQSKGKSGGWLQVDSLWQDTLVVKPLLTNQSPDTAVAGAEDRDIVTRLTRSLNLKADRNLKEVTISGSKPTNLISTETIPITLALQKEYGNLAQYLVNRIPEARIIYQVCKYCGIGGERPDAMFLDRVGVRGVYADKSPIDYCYICQEDYLMQPMNNVIKVIITESSGWGGRSAWVSVVLRPGALEPKDAFDNTMADMIGYYKGRVFYKPNPKNPDLTNDQRINTIYWEPNIVTDENGQANLAFNNAPAQGNLRVVVEGVTDKGDVVTALAKYKVE